MPVYRIPASSIAVGATMSSTTRGLGCLQPRSSTASPPPLSPNNLTLRRRPSHSTVGPCGHRSHPDFRHSGLLFSGYSVSSSDGSFFNQLQSTGPRDPESVVLGRSCCRLSSMGSLLPAGHLLHHPGHPPDSSGSGQSKLVSWPSLCVVLVAVIGLFRCACARSSSSSWDSLRRGDSHMDGRVSISLSGLGLALLSVACWAAYVFFRG